MSSFYRATSFACIALASAASALALTASPRVAWAQAPAPSSAAAPLEKPAKSVLVVEIAADPADLEASSLRRAIGAELGEDAVAPEDPRALTAVGTVRISIDRTAHTLVVAYRGAADPITRAVDLPPDRATRERAAVLLTGNLARNEGDDLAKSLQKSAPSAQEEAPPAPQPPPPPADSEAMGELDRLGAIFVFHQKNGAPRKTAAKVLWWSGLATLLASPALELGSIAARGDAGLYVAQYATVASGVLFGVSALVAPGDFSDLNEKYLSWREYIRPADARADLELTWRNAAAREHHHRFVGGLVYTIVGGALVALAGVGLGAQATSATADPRETGPVVFGAAGAVGLTALGVHWLTSSGEVETALHEYERDSGHTVAPRATETKLRPFLVPTNGGAMLGVGGEL
jgi:hypothetical protein